MRGGQKFNAKWTVCNVGHNHPSKREAKRCDDLHILQRSGAITGLEREPRFFFPINGTNLRHITSHSGRQGREVSFRPDFGYIDLKTGTKVVEDVKSVATMTTDFMLRAALFTAIYPTIELRVIT